MGFRLLIFIPSPRDIPEFADAVELLKDDKLWIKYTSYDEFPNPYQRAVNFFLKHKEYSHFAICPDDMIPTEKEIEILKKDLIDNNLEMVTGHANVNNKNMNKLSICMNKVHPDRQKRDYKMMMRDELPKEDLFECGWQGTAFMILSKELVKKIQWVGDKIDNFNPQLGIQAFDVGICYQLHRMKIPIYVDKRAFFVHLKGNGAEIKCGKEPQDAWLDRRGHDRIMNSKAVRKLEHFYKEYKKKGGMGRIWVDELIEGMVNVLNQTTQDSTSWVYEECVKFQYVHKV